MSYDRIATGILSCQGLCRSERGCDGCPVVAANRVVVVEVIVGVGFAAVGMFEPRVKLMAVDELELYVDHGRLSRVLKMSPMMRYDGVSMLRARKDGITASPRLRYKFAPRNTLAQFQHTAAESYLV